jgi:hypothetical protein
MFHVLEYELRDDDTIRFLAFFRHNCQREDVVYGCVRYEGPFSYRGE